jgi:hypothetical protein
MDEAGATYDVSTEVIANRAENDPIGTKSPVTGARPAVEAVM